MAKTGVVRILQRTELSTARLLLRLLIVGSAACDSSCTPVAGGDARKVVEVRCDGERVSASSTLLRAFASTSFLRSQSRRVLWGYTPAEEQWTQRRQRYRYAPRSVAAGIAAFDADLVRFCALHEDGRVECQVATGGAVEKTDFSLQDTNSDAARWADLAVGGEWICGLSVRQQLACVGTDGATRRFRCVRQIDAAPEYLCAVDCDGIVRCVGQSEVLGHAAAETDAAWSGWRRIDSSQPVNAVAAAEDHACVVTRSERVECWGNNESGAASPITSNVAIPRPADVAVADARTVCSGGGYSCALLTCGEVVCWGHNSSGELAVSQRGVQLDRTRVVLARPATQLACGQSHACALLDDERAACWGADDLGQIGTSVQGLWFGGPMEVDLAEGERPSELDPPEGG